MITLRRLREIAEKEFGRTRLAAAHLLWVWLELEGNEEPRMLLTGSGIDANEMRAAIAPFLSDPLDADKKLLIRAIQAAGNEEVRAFHVVKALMQSEEGRLLPALVERGLDPGKVLRNITGLESGMGELSRADINLAKSGGTVLEYGRDLLQLARDRAFSELSGRERDLDLLMDVLLRKRKGNPVITGPAGVGKTALVELLANRIIFDPKCPLRNYRLCEISMGKLVAGTRYRGDFEARVEEVMKEMSQNVQSILFIDEIHLLLGSGKAEGTAIDGANLLKPYLARDSFKVIGATTCEEYLKFFSTDAALERRFQEIKLGEPDRSDLEQIVGTQMHSLARHHQVVFDPRLAGRAIELTGRYMPGKPQPDKAIDVLDTAGVVAKREGRAEVTDRDILNAVSTLACAPVRTLAGIDPSFMKGLAEEIKRKIIGQDEAVDLVVAHLAARQFDLSGAERPLGVFLFAGDTGVGKTEMARVLAETYFRSPGRLVQFDLGEYTTEASVNKLAGAPPGYLGSDRDGLLIQALSEHAHCVLLFDELEKAHPDVHKLLLGLLDTGRFSNRFGKDFDARQCIIVMTTNAVRSGDPAGRGIGFTGRVEKTDIFDKLAEIFPSEFLGRIDAVIPFKNLTNADLGRIASLRIAEILEELRNKGIAVRCDAKRLAAYICAELAGLKTGARGVRQLLERKLIHPLSLALLETAGRDTRELVLDEVFYLTGSIKTTNT